MSEQTETREIAARRAYDTWRWHYDHVTRWNELFPGAQVLWLNVADAVLSANRTELDWADLREMARNAGWTGRGGARWAMWGVWSGEDVADEHGWVIYHRFMESTQVTIVGPGSGHMGNRSHAELKNPTPAQVLTVARELDIGGAA